MRRRGTIAFPLRLIAFLALVVVVSVPPAAGAAVTVTSPSVQSTLFLVSDQRVPGNVVHGFPVPEAVTWDSVNGLLYVADRAGSLFGVNVSSNTVVSQQYLGGTLAGLVVVPASNRLFVAVTSTNRVAVVNGSSGKLLSTVPVGISPTGVAFNPLNGTVYAANSGSNNLTAINATTDKVTGSLPAGLGPTWVADDRYNGELFVSNGASCPSTATHCNVTVVSSATGKVLTTVSVGNRPGRIVFDPRTHNLFLAESPASRVVVLNGSTAVKITSTPIGPTANPVDLAVDAQNHLVYVVASSNLTVLNASTWRWVGATTVSYQSTAIAFDGATHALYLTEDYNYLTSSSTAVLHAFSPATATFTAAVQLATAPDNILYNGYNHRLYVLDQITGKMYVLNATSLKTVAILPGLGGSSFQGGTGWYAGPTMAYDPGTGKVFAPNGLKITVLGAANSILGNISDSHGPVALAYDPGNGDLYAANADANLTVYHVATNATVATLALTGVGSPGYPASASGVSFDARNGRVLVAASSFSYSADSGTVGIFVVNATSNKIVAHNATGSLATSWTAVNPHTAEFYVLSDDPAVGQGYLEVYNANNAQWLKEISFSFSTTSELTGVAFDSANGMIYVVGSNELVKINGTTNAVVGNVSVGGFPVALTFDPALKALVIADQGSGTLSIAKP
ncbi:MAG: hypothetical protein L3K07_07795 [Thermoplasmata archaeon]|nr:hypothetical protein [Thermoplasmata archaeon]